MAHTIKGMTLAELKEFLMLHNYPKYRADQIYTWMYKRGVFEFNSMHNLSRDLVAFLNNNCILKTLDLSKTIQSHQTIKFLFKTKMNMFIESVSMIDNNRHTLCLSSQVGCNVDCDFCATGKMGFKQNLSAGEIIDQLLCIKNFIKTPVTNIVFMGMGEPFLNYKNVIRAADIMHNKSAFNLGAQRITISTAGVLPKINRFIKEKVKYNLAISLNASNDITRNQLMPINKKWPIDSLIDVAQKYNNTNKTKITFEYVLIDSVNDSIQDAENLAKLLRNTNSKLNIIPFNEIGNEYKRPSSEDIENFVNKLYSIREGFTILVRWSKGLDINAGCGQLATSNI